MLGLKSQLSCIEDNTHASEDSTSNENEEYVVQVEEKMQSILKDILQMLNQKQIKLPTSPASDEDATAGENEDVDNAEDKPTTDYEEIVKSYMEDLKKLLRLQPCNNNRTFDSKGR